MKERMIEYLELLQVVSFYLTILTVAKITVIDYPIAVNKYIISYIISYIGFG
jgi:hypothetical protein